MGLSSSRVQKTLTNSPEFDTACHSVFDECLDLSQHAFPGVMAYQLPGAAARLHSHLLVLLPIVKRWVPSPPDQGQVDRAVLISRGEVKGTALTLTWEEFKAFAVELFKGAILSSARGTVLRRGSIGIAGIAGAGMVTRSSREAFGTVMSVYALGLAIAVFLTL
ncbi:hypothetical protein MRB53_002176 [Persea americana]|uniref:Uncharacterized protein n=1 Tax=Persea americana TaxID=3435 RepID=A0ACC2MUP6_PERAE|nr:hypothetical protein MRB53_002176 [Persea americana]